MIILLLGWMAIDDKCERRDKLLLLPIRTNAFYKNTFYPHLPPTRCFIDNIGHEDNIMW